MREGVVRLTASPRRGKPTVARAVVRKHEIVIYFISYSYN